MNGQNLNTIYVCTHTHPGAGIFGSLSDSRLGRKGTLTLVCILNSISGILTAFSPNFWTYFALRTATGFSAGGLGLCSFVLATESVGPNKRGPVGMSTFYFFSGGIMLLSGLALLTSSWRHLCIIISIPSLLYCIKSLLKVSRGNLLLKVNCLQQC